MVKSGQAAIRAVHFNSRLHPGIPVEVVERRDLLTRLDHTVLARPERVSFTTLMLVRSGQGTHTIDFESVELAPGHLVRLLPGQVQSWDLGAEVDVAAVLAATPRARPVEAIDPPASCALDTDMMATATGLVEAIRREQARFDGEPASAALLIALFAALDAIFEREMSGGAVRELPQAYVAFHRALEHDLGRTHSIKDYAAQLGYSERTLSRACREVTGLTAKGVLTDRLVLEARRQLAHSDDTVGAIGRRLGFSEPTNFHKFFVRAVGQRPMEFRAALRPRT